MSDKEYVSMESVALVGYVYASKAVFRVMVMSGEQ